SLYGIHGTNIPWGVGMQVTHGCVRLYPEDIERLYPLVPVGTPVEFTYQSVKVGTRGADVYVEVHRDIYRYDRSLAADSRSASALMGLWARYPIAVAPAMGHNFYFAFVVAGPVAAGGLGYSWQAALGANCVAGIVFLVLSLVGLRERLIAAIPPSLQHAIATG